MNATARDLPGADTDMNETVVYHPNNPAQAQAVASDSESGSGGTDRATGSSDMPTTTPPPTPQGQGRYTYGSGARPLDGYTIKRAIGRGGFGEVYYATSDSGKEVALKLILRNLEVERRGVVQCMNLKCPNLLTVYDLKSNNAGDTFVVMEYVAGPSLAQVLGRHPKGLPAAEARAWLRGLVEGVAYLHDHGIVHRDLKPANLFMEEGIVKIGDYGLAKLITPSQGTEHSESIGTCHYMAPEIASGKYHKPIDVYAIGVILYEMLTGRVPFEGETVGEVLMKHLTARPDVSPLPEPFRSIVAKALAKDPAQRPQRVYDLLPPDDAPRSPTVRFIGDGKIAPPLPDAGPEKPKDDVLRIEAEEPVYYIGPETRPPRQPIAQRLRAAWQRPQARPPQPPPQVRTQVPPARPQPQPRPQVRRPQPPVQLKPVKPPEPPPPPPSLPGARVRVAELAGSMLWAALATAVLAVIAAVWLGVDLNARPEQLVYLYTTALLGTWGVLLPAKALEGRKVNVKVRKLIYLVIGVLVGLAVWALAGWLGVGALPSWETGSSEVFRNVAGPAPAPSALGYATYFGLVYCLIGWSGMTARDRDKRFRIVPAAKAALVAGLLGVLWPSPQPLELAAVGLVALVAQSVTPWSAPAAAYARYAARAARANRRIV
jgi:eukaryotic-like serine/threonine-protein kinase